MQPKYNAFLKAQNLWQEAWQRNGLNRTVRTSSQRRCKDGQISTLRHFGHIDAKRMISFRNTSTTLCHLAY